MTDEFKDVKFTGISVTDGKSPSINFDVMDCINAKIVGLSILRTDLTPRNLENLIASNNAICEDPEEICNFLLKNYNSNLKTRWWAICSGSKMQICLRLSHRCEQSNDSLSNPPLMQFTV